MDFTLITERLGMQIRSRRQNLGLTQAQLAQRARLTRQKIIAVEQGCLTVTMVAYAKALGALGCELQVVPAVMPTLDEIQGMFE
ncbi:helix-turn-helix domain-containing protein [Pseudomonas sp. PSKL.D1]|uniref:helix-turn-helix domain-containing protein n=1 Tax=Pseudomonas sp. PSKL.D1 TaxID=3029060 RepID=UPI0023810DCF|nr:helix-turn-helix domain-containing protein [Pseudomonas sp. PSKL.D1]WDY57923.1 helix-turn-helix domain-containing protein [Pseudomonas sp. PSKL.D1]